MANLNISLGLFLYKVLGTEYFYLGLKLQNILTTVFPVSFI